MSGYTLIVPNETSSLDSRRPSMLAENTPMRYCIPKDRSILGSIGSPVQLAGRRWGAKIDAKRNNEPKRYISFCDEESTAAATA
jgi:hypothetical protein